jgi:hypothetical protein
VLGFTLSLDVEDGITYATVKLVEDINPKVSRWRKS